MKLRVLGCSGGIGGSRQRTTSLLIDHDILIDAGTGVEDLTIEELARIDHIFLTHSHVDHICALPLMIDTVAERRRGRPVVVHAPLAVCEILRQHLFNWLLWPDFFALPSPENPLLRYHEMEVGEKVSLGGRTIISLPVDHTVPAVGYALASEESTLVFSGDTGPCDAFWDAVNALSKVKNLIIECAFPNRGWELALISKHLCPDLLASELKKLQHECSIFITHLKPGQSELTMEEIEYCLEPFQPTRLETNQIITF